MIDPKDIKEFDAVAGRLVKLMKRIREYSPEAEIFMEAESGLMLFDGLTRDESTGAMNWDNKVGKSHWTTGFGCGAI